MQNIVKQADNIVKHYRENKQIILLVILNTASRTNKRTLSMNKSVTPIIFTLPPWQKNSNAHKGNTEADYENNIVVKTAHLYTSPLTKKQQCVQGGRRSR